MIRRDFLSFLTSARPYLYPSSASYPFLYSDDEELHREANDVSGVKAMPNRQKEECEHVRQDLVAEESTPLKDISKKEKTRDKTSQELSLLTKNLDAVRKAHCISCHSPHGKHSVT